MATSDSTAARPRLNITKEVIAMRLMTLGQLRAKYSEAFGDTTNARHKDWMIKRIIWRLQALAEGDLSERARRRAAELANDADLRRRPPKSPSPAPEAAPRTVTTMLSRRGDKRVPLAGSVITRIYKGQALAVNVRSAGFEFEGDVYKSLSAVAKKITGTHRNGYAFFRLTREGGAE